MHTTTTNKNKSSYSQNLHFWWHPQNGNSFCCCKHTEQIKKEESLLIYFSLLCLQPSLCFNAFFTFPLLLPALGYISDREMEVAKLLLLLMNIPFSILRSVFIFCVVSVSCIYSFFLLLSLSMPMSRVAVRLGGVFSLSIRGRLHIEKFHLHFLVWLLAPTSEYLPCLCSVVRCLLLFICL